MIKFLVIQIRLGNITIADVPAKYRSAVENELNGGDKL